MTKEEFKNQAMMSDMQNHSYQDFAERMWELINPIMKPLPELANSEEDCQKLFEFIFNKGKVKSVAKEEFYTFKISGFFNWDISRKASGEVILWPDGDIFLREASKDVSIENPFAISDFIRSLGYEPIKK